MVWNGDQVLKQFMDDAVAAVDEATEEGAQLAQADAPRDTGDLADSMQNEPAKRDGDDVVGRFGADQAVFYAAAVEALHPTKAGFIRRAGDRAAAKLPERIAAKVD